MSGTAMYQKYRPQAFDDVRGQEHVVAPLKKAVENNAFVHAYLFSGTRGTGKTSVARLFAKAIGCTNEDIHEIDAASYTGVDDVRELREAARSLPFASPYKVYIIDEVHMLSRSAFNALLKTLEEPPRHVVFVLATTETHKLPDTVVSRCQHYAFQKPSQQTLKQSAEEIAKREGYTLESDAADVVAMLGDGSFRDMQGVLQKVFGSVSGKKITRSDIEECTNVPNNALVNEIVDALAEDSAVDALAAVQKAQEQTTDFGLLMKLLLNQCRTILLLRFAKDLKKEVEESMSATEYERLNRLAGKDGKRINSDVLRELLDANAAINHAYLPQLPLELAIIKLCGEGKEE